jgi:hypothetical protein
MQVLLQELQLPEVGTLVIEAAGTMPRAEFIPQLEALQSGLSWRQDD